MKQAINTRTQEEYDALMRYYEEQKATWILTGKAASALDVWYVRKVNTCVICYDGKLTHSSIGYCRKQSIPVIPYTEFAKANIAPEIDYKALYLKGRELLQMSMDFIPRYSFTVENKIKANLVGGKIKQFLTNHKDGE